MSAPHADLSALANVRAAWVSAVAARDAGALRELVTDDYEVWANAAPSIVGPDAVVSAMRAALDPFHVQQRFDPIETVISCRSMLAGIQRILRITKQTADEIAPSRRNACHSPFDPYRQQSSTRSSPNSSSFSEIR
jgi:ketosteroid isomerase-like protein